MSVIQSVVCTLLYAVFAVVGAVLARDYGFSLGAVAVTVAALDLAGTLVVVLLAWAITVAARLGR